MHNIYQNHQISTIIDTSVQLFRLAYFSLALIYRTTPYDAVRRRIRPIAIYGCYHSIPGEILSHFYVRKSSESPILTILEALLVNRFHKSFFNFAIPRENVQNPTQHQQKQHN